jgi:NADH:ubiquinone oxidoreductase subunit F (NADH-binding)
VTAVGSRHELIGPVAPSEVARTSGPDAPVVPRLLAGLRAPGSTPDLEHHHRVHGRLPQPDRRSHSAWIGRLLAEVEGAGLTGRGGAGFPTSRKIAALRKSWRKPAVVINAMDSEPAAGKDWLLATGTPHLVLDGAATLARLVDAASVTVCVSEARADAAQALRIAVGQRAQAGVDPVAIEVRQPPDRYVAGEESSLVHWLDAGVARPLSRRNGPSDLVLANRPVLIHNAETVCHLALVARHGARWFRDAPTALGLDVPPIWGAAGTMLASVGGAVERPGIFEVPVGLHLDRLLAYAGAPSSSPGVLLGGYGGTWLPPGALGTPMAPEPLRRLADTFGISATLGAGVVLVLPPGSCPLAETARIARWMAAESAGQCGPCVFGLPALAEDLEALASGTLRGDGFAHLRHHLEVVAGRGACRHPDGVVRMVRTSLTAFARHVQDHVAKGPCPGVAMPGVAPLPARPLPGNVAVDPTPTRAEVRVSVAQSGTSRVR